MPLNRGMRQLSPSSLFVRSKTHLRFDDPRKQQDDLALALAGVELAGGQAVDLW
jgi:hypothetical protein